MVITELTIRELGSITDLNLSFGRALNVVKQRPLREISYALQTVFNSKICPLAQDGWLNDKSAVEARVILADVPYRITAQPSAAQDRLLLRAYDSEGVECTEDYLLFSAHCRAHDEADFFDGDDTHNAERLLALDWESMHSDEMYCRTDGMCALGGFRAYWRAFVKNFEPESLCASKPYEIRLGEDGRYAAWHPSLHEHACLSEAEQRLFRYLCFLRTAEFWHAFEQQRNLCAVKKPLLLQNFSEKIDESVDLNEPIRRLCALDRQTLILCAPYEKRTF